MKSDHTFMLCAETYRTKEQSYDADDYVVDGIKLLYFPFSVDDIKSLQDSSNGETTTEVLSKRLQFALKLFVEQLKNPLASPQIAKTFPRFSSLQQSEHGYWYHITTNADLAKRPKEFNSNAFTEEQLLGISEEESDLVNVSFYFNSDGEVIDGPPDKFMLSLGAA